jgi:hypothetical protein
LTTTSADRTPAHSAGRSPFQNWFDGNGQNVLMLYTERENKKKSR